MDESRTEEELMDFSLDVSEVNDDSLYVPTPERSLKKLNPVAIPKKVYMVSFEQLNLFVETIISVRCCVTPGCKGILVPLSLQSKGLGGTVNVSYVCNGCGISKVFFEGSLNSKSLNTTEVGASIQVAFIISGCLYALYCKVLKLSLGLDTVDFSAFYSTMKRRYPVIKQMVDEMCEEAKDEMKTMDEHTLGSRIPSSLAREVMHRAKEEGIRRCPLANINVLMMQIHVQSLSN